MALALSFAAGCTAAGKTADDDEDAGIREKAGLTTNLHTLWIHGRAPKGGGTPGDYRDFSYWGSASESAGADKQAVNWGGRDRVSESNGWIRNALDCFCTGENWCVVAAHSAGDVQIGYALAHYGGSDREVMDGQPDGSGLCTGTGSTQTGWNIKWVSVAGGASGGTELADLGEWAVSDPLTSDLRTDTARSLYDHGSTQGIWVYRFAGAKGTAYSGVLPGQDDEVIAYHSSGGMAKTGSFCNPGDWFCGDTLEYDEAASPKKGVGKWDHHTVLFRDDSEARDHYTRGKWGGIVGPMRADTEQYAQ